MKCSERHWRDSTLQGGTAVGRIVGNGQLGCSLDLLRPPVPGPAAGDETDLRDRTPGLWCAAPWCLTPSTVPMLRHPSGPGPTGQMGAGCCALVSGVACCCPSLGEPPCTQGPFSALSVHRWLSCSVAGTPDSVLSHESDSKKRYKPRPTNLLLSPPPPSYRAPGRPPTHFARAQLGLTADIIATLWLPAVALATILCLQILGTSRAQAVFPARESWDPGLNF